MDGACGAACAADAIGQDRSTAPYPAELLLRIHFLQQWLGLSDPAMEEALYDVPIYRQFMRWGTQA